MSLLSDSYDPWTEGATKFRLYNQPQVASIMANEVDVGRIVEVNVFADEESQFFKSLPASNMGFNGGDDDKPVMSGYGGIKCKFGRFG